jgi:hypothetical protein
MARASRRRGGLLSFLAFLVLVGLALFLVTKFKQPDQENYRPGGAPACATGTADLRKHVYGPDRLRPLPQGCITVTGTVEAVLTEDDGDRHIWLTPDQAYKSLLAPGNHRGAGSHHGLVLEIICVGRITQADVGDACTGYHNDVTIPKAHGHIRATGWFVFDTAHQWNELHPVDEIEAA